MAKLDETIGILS